jgi:hypothetical protein
VARERQVEFPPNQTHDPRIVPVMLVLCLICIAIVVILVAADVDGPFIGPWG